MAVFPQNWVVDVQTAVAGNVSPCWVDIIGFAGVGNEATDHQLPIVAPDSDFIYFRMRLNGNPLTGISMNPIENAVWGVEIRDLCNEIIFVARMNGIGNTDKLQILIPNGMAGTVIYEEDIILSDPDPDEINVEITEANTDTACPDDLDDYFLDFKLPRDEFKQNGDIFDFDTETYKFCYFTSQNANNINKEQPLCGPFINPPDDKPFLNVQKDIVGPNPIDVNVVGEWTLIIKIENPSDFDVTDVVVNDTILNPETIIKSLNPSKGDAVEGPPGEITWDNFDLLSKEMATLEIVIEGAFSTTGCRFLDQGVINGKWDNGQQDIDEVMFCDCGICVVQPTPPPPITRGLDLFSVIE